MRHRVRNRGRLPLVLVAAVGISLAAATPSIAAPAEPLGHAGRWITDAEGRVVVLHGFNTVPFDETIRPVDMGMGPDNAEWLADNGFNTIRLGLYYARIEPQPGVYDLGYLDDFLRVQRELADRGVFTLLDFHQDQLHPRYGTGGSLPSRGFPEWMMRDDGLPNTQAGYPQGYFANPALNRAYDNLWAGFDAPDGVSIHEHFAEGWRRVAATFRDRAGLLGYDIFNEPWPGTPAATCAQPAGCPPGGFDQTLLTDFNRKIAAAVRQVDPAHLIFYEPNLQFDFGAQTQVGDVGDENAGFSFHDYCLNALVPGSPSQQPCEVGEELVLDNAEAHVARTGDALLNTEFGFDLPAATRITRLMDEHMMSWQFWDYYGDLENGLHVPSLPVLIRPYPQLVSGTPLGWSFDPETKEFELSYSTERARGEGDVDGAPGSYPAGSVTEVFVPRYQYPDGYGVEVVGAAVHSGAGTQRLELASCPGAERVEVRIAKDIGPPAGCARQEETGGACAFTARGTRGADRLRGTRAGDRLLGRAGDDRLAGRRGEDCLRGGRGDDRIAAAADGARDRVDCGGGKRDRARVDAADEVRRCERVRRR